MAVLVHLEVEPARQRVHHRHADAVQTARHLVAAAAELAARVQHGERDLCARLALVLGVRIGRDPAAVVGDTHRAVGEDRDVDAGALTRHRLVDRVVEQLPDEVVEAGRTRGSDVHAGSFADGIEALQDLDALGVVRHSMAPSRGRRGARGPGAGDGVRTGSAGLRETGKSAGQSTCGDLVQCTSWEAENGGCHGAIRGVFAALPRRRDGACGAGRQVPTRTRTDVTTPSPTAAATPATIAVSR